MKQIIFSLFFIGQFTLAFAQGEILNGKVTDEKGVSLAYVNIGLLGTTTGTVSDEKGDYKLFLTQPVQPTDSIQFSMIGYNHKKFSLANFIKQQKENTTITLSQQNFDLPEIVVQSKFKNTKTIGHGKTSPKRVVNFSIKNKPNQNLGAAIGKRFKLPSQRNKLESFRFFVKNNNFDTIRFRVNVYELKNNRPTKNILQENIIVELNDQQSGWIFVDLAPYEIYTQKNIAVSIEWIHYSQNGKFLTLPLTFPKFGSTHFYKYGSQSKWKRFKRMSTAMQLQISW